MDNNGIDPTNQGAPDNQNLENPDLGNQGGEGGQGEGASAGQGGQQTDPRDATIAQQKRDIQALNKAIIEARRGSQRQQPQNNQNANGQQPYNAFEDPAGQYAISLQLATGELSRNLENIYSLYPEVPASEISRIRKNPWAFASFESYRAGDWQTAQLEVEQALLERAQELASEDKGQGAGGQNTPNQPKVNPASINTNSAAEAQAEAVPGTVEDENPWTMPMDKLEKVAQKERAKLQTKS